MRTHARAVAIAVASWAAACGGAPAAPPHPADAVVPAPAATAPVVPTPPKHSFRDAALAADVDWAKGVAAEDNAFSRLDRGDAEGALAGFEEACTLRAECNQSRAGAALALRALGEDRDAHALIERVRADAERRAGAASRIEESVPPLGVFAASTIGSRWAVVSYGELVMLRATTLQEIARIRLPKHEGPVPGRYEERMCAERCSASAFSRDGRWFAWTGVGDSLDLVDVTSGRAATVAHDTGWDPMDVQFSPDGTLLASNVKDGIALFEIASRARLRVVPGKAPLAFSADGARITTSAGVFDVATGRALGTGAPKAKPLPQKTPEFRRVPSPDGKLLAAAAVLDYLELLDLATTQKTRTWNTHLAFEGIAFSPDGTTIAAWGRPAHLLLLDARGQSDRDLDGTELGKRDVIDDAAFSHDGKLIVARALTPAIAVWDVTSGTRTALWKKGDGRRACAIGRDRFPVEVCGS
jgi:hypothetical protein